MPRQKSFIEVGLKNLRKKNAPKVEEPTEQSEQNQQNINMNARERLLIAMDQVVFTCPVEGRYTADDLLNKRVQFSELKQVLDNAKTMEEPEVAKMDEIMIVLCGDLNKALEYGDVASVEYIMQALAYGIYKGHETLSGSQEEEKNAILQDRLDKINTFKDICAYAKLIDEKNKSLNTLNKQLAEEQDIYLRSLSIAIQAKKDEANREDIRIIRTLGGNKEKMNPDQLELAAILDAPVKASDNIEDLSVNRYTIKKELTEYQNGIRLLERDLGNCWNNLMEQLRNRINEIGEKESQRIAKEMEDIAGVEEAWERLHVSYQKAYQTDRVAEYLTSSLDKFEKLYQKHLEGRDPGRGIRQIYEPTEEIETEDVAVDQVHVGV